MKKEKKMRFFLCLIIALSLTCGSVSYARCSLGSQNSVARTRVVTRTAVLPRRLARRSFTVSVNTTRATLSRVGEVRTNTQKRRANRKNRRQSRRG